MQIEVFDSTGQSVCTLDNDDAQLNTYPIADDMRIHVRRDFVSSITYISIVLVLCSACPQLP